MRVDCSKFPVATDVIRLSQFRIDLLRLGSLQVEVVAFKKQMTPVKQDVSRQLSDHMTHLMKAFIKIRALLKRKRKLNVPGIKRRLH
ncbi:hypothetical protein PR048_003676 [Dryococelus australis]|uniref:Uncharacterized protein n=1 Tax=Dryococelus australis TaxID=614101 RepID=A0ABQ9INU3_9NEOP|nr:hypothetical protein PR048_003676 [Dryococelus australis]